MHCNYSRAAVAVAAAALTLSAQAQTAGKTSAKEQIAGKPSATTAAELPPVVVTGNPLGADLFDLVTPASVLFGTDLFLGRRSTLGETLADLPGVSSTYFGPNASRPVIRGLDSDRIRILQNGTGVLDASSLSFDHAVAVDPLVIERAEVVRGPAALLYGGSAVGGVVNVIDNRIPQAPVSGVTGRAEARFGGAEREKAGAAVLEAGNGRFAAHADVHHRDTDDLRIKGPNVSARLQAQDPALAVTHGTLPNSAARAEGGGLGASWTWNKGYAGLSYGSFDTLYGTVAEPEVTIDMRSERVDFAGEARDLGNVITGVKFKLGHTDYRHTERDAGVPATDFSSRGYDTRVEFTHAPIGRMRGAFGVQFGDLDFAALGAEAFVPSTNTSSRAVFVYEELPLGRVNLSAGARYERTEVSSDGGGPADPASSVPRFDPAQSRTFNATSGAIGAVWSFTPILALAVNGAYTERAPTFHELYANGPHAATGAYELGNATFTREQSKSLDIALRARSGLHAGSIGYFRNRFDNYTTLFASGNTRGADGELNPADTIEPGVSDASGEEILPELVYRQVSARFRGWEAEGRFRVLDRGGTLDVLAKYDYVRADDRSTGLPLPRIAPHRFGAGLDYRNGALGARLDATWVADQDRVSANELPTDGYTMVNAAVTCRVKFGMTQGSYAEFFLRGVNLLDEEARNHVSFLKDIAPLGRRAGQMGVRASF